MKIKARKSTSLLMAFMLTLGLFTGIPLTAYAVTAGADEVTVDIAETDTFADIQADIQNAIVNAAYTTVIVTGAKTETGNNSLALTIPAGKTVIWKANYENNSGTNTPAIAIDATSAGTFEVATGGNLSVPTAILGTAIKNESSCAISITGGTVSATTGTAIRSTGTGVVNVTGGTISATTGTAINASGAVSVSGDNTLISATTGRAINAPSAAVTVTGSSGSSYNNAKVTSANSTAGQATIVAGSVTVSGAGTFRGIVENTGGGSAIDATTINVNSAGWVTSDLGTAIHTDAAAAAVTVNAGRVDTVSGIGIYMGGSNSTVTVSNASAMVEATGDGGKAIVSAGAVSSTGGWIRVSGADGIAIETSGTVSVTGGGVENSDSGYAILGSDGSTVTVGGNGFVEAKGGANSHAIKADQVNLTNSSAAYNTSVMAASGIAITANLVNASGTTVVNESPFTGTAIKIENATGAVNADATTNLTVNGNIVSTGNGVAATGGGRVTVDGTITIGAGQEYIKTGTAVKAIGDTSPTTKTGYLTYTDTTSTVWVLDATAAPVCQIIGGSTYTSLKAAVDAMNAGETKTIKMLANSNETDSIVVDGKTVNLDMNSFDIDLDTSGIALSQALSVENDGKLLQTGTGTFNITGAFLGVYTNQNSEAVLSGSVAAIYAVEAHNGAKVTLNGDASGGMKGVNAYSGAKITVNGNVTAAGINGIGTYATDANTAITITGNVTSSGWYGVVAEEYSTVIINGNVTSTTDAGVLVGNSTVTVTGSVSCKNDAVFAYGNAIVITGPLTSANQDGVVAEDTSVVTVNGNITSVVHDGVLGSDEAVVTVNGNINAGRFGVWAQGWTGIIVNGTITSVSGDIVVLSDKDPATRNLTSTKTGYIEYTDGDHAFVWVASADMLKVQQDKAWLTFDKIKNANTAQNNITGSLTLPNTGGVNGSTITWTPAPAGYINNSTGVVTRPANDTTVTLTATITSGTVSDTVVFTLVVKGADGGTTPSGSGTRGGGSSVTTPAYSIDVNGKKVDPSAVNTSKASYVIDIGAAEIKNGTAYVTLPAGLLTSWQGKNATFFIEIHTPYGIYKIPVNLAALIPRLTALLTENSLKLEEISFRITLIDKSSDNTILDAFKNGLPKATALGAIVDFKVEIWNNKTEKIITAADIFTKALTRMIPMPDGRKAMPKLWGAFRYDETEKAFVFVPHTTVVIDGVVYAAISSMTNSVYVVTENPVSFTDTASHWGKNLVDLAGAKGLVAGIGNNLYSPDEALTRAEFATMLTRALSITRTNPAIAPYTDIKASDWFYGYVSAAKSAGLLGFVTGSDFKPDEPIRRDEMAHMIAQAFKVYGDSTTLTDAEQEAALGKFSDSGNILYKKEAALVISKGIIVGWDGKFWPDETHTRAETATVLIRTLRELGMIDK